KPSEENKLGRRTKLTPAVQQKILRAIRAGNYASVAAASAGIDDSTFYRWLERGEKGEEPYCEFREAIKKASADAEQEALADIRKAGKTNWQARAWYLERCHPARWGRRDRLEHASPGSEQVKVNLDVAGLIERIFGEPNNDHPEATD